MQLHIFATNILWNSFNNPRHIEILFCWTLYTMCKHSHAGWPIYCMSQPILLIFCRVPHERYLFRNFAYLLLLLLYFLQESVLSGIFVCTLSKDLNFSKNTLTGDDIFTSAKEVMFLPALVCWFVYLWPTLHKKLGKVRNNTRTIWLDFGSDQQSRFF